ncbi:hypothetical protein BIY23_00335 [Wolbachia pipientis]|uniref:Uncharacterized protein n=1 Tax=Wolbachia pipientis TaxID=955 RepID=A0A1E7QKD3_WOLPI|nr:invasion associated locus B family protein [Wolbachia pipientis]OEY86940.1 hypothetical protein BIY23_00335 [Wolbachia pipientis]
MRSLLIFLLLCSIKTFGLASETKLQDKRLQEKYKDWLVYTALEDGEKLCYIVSYPQKKDSNYTTNRKPYVMVSYIGNAVDEVSVTSGFAYDKEEPVVLSFISEKYTLPVIDGNFAWTENIHTDKRLILKMKQGLSMTVSGQVKAQMVYDTYSLLGFQKAYKKMHDLCNAKSDK